MTTRTFRQHALGYGTTTATITAKIDGTIVFDGEVTTQNIISPALPNYQIDMHNVAYIWTGDSSYQGVVSVEVTVNSGMLLLAYVEANNPLIDVDEFGRLDIVSTGSGEEDFIAYPYVTDEKINGVSIPGQQIPKRQGQGWNWIAAGNTWSANLHVTESKPLPEPDPNLIAPKPELTDSE